MNFCKPCVQWFNLDSSDLLHQVDTPFVNNFMDLFAIRRLYIKCLQEFVQIRIKHVMWNSRTSLLPRWPLGKVLEPQSISNFLNWRFSWIGPFNCIIAILSIVPFQMSLFEELKTWRSTWKCRACLPSKTDWCRLCFPFFLEDGATRDYQPHVGLRIAAHQGWPTGRIYFPTVWLEGLGIIFFTRGTSKQKSWIFSFDKSLHTPHIYIYIFEVFLFAPAFLHLKGKSSRKTEGPKNAVPGGFPGCLSGTWAPAYDGRCLVGTTHGTRKSHLERCNFWCSRIFILR